MTAHKSEMMTGHTSLPTDYYAVGKDLRTGQYPGTVVASFASHWDAVADMMRRGDAADADSAK